MSEGTTDPDYAGSADPNAGYNFARFEYERCSSGEVVHRSLETDGKVWRLMAA